MMSGFSKLVVASILILGSLEAFAHPGGVVSRPSTSPVDATDDKPSGKLSDEGLLNKLKYYAQYSAAAYCDPHHIENTKMTCQRSICAMISANKVTTIKEFHNKGPTDVTGVVARDDTNKQIVVAWRGSSSIKNWLTNLKFLHTDVPYCAGCKAHSGFLESFVAERDNIVKAIAGIRANNDYKDYKLVLTGHSLGGAIASIAAAHFRYGAKAENPHLYTYGAPKIGNQAFASFVSAAGKGDNYFVTNLNDPVPMIPPDELGYAYMNPAYHITADKDGQETVSDVETIPKRTKKFEILKGMANAIQLIDDHLHYFSKLNMDACR